MFTKHTQSQGHRVISNEELRQQLQQEGRELAEARRLAKLREQAQSQRPQNQQRT